MDGETKRKLQTRLIAVMREQAKKIRKRHRSVMAQREGIPFHLQPLDASYWANELDEAKRLEDAADESEAMINKREPGRVDQI